MTLNDFDHHYHSVSQKDNISKRLRLALIINILHGLSIGSHGSFYANELIDSGVSRFLNAECMLLIFSKLTN